MKRIFSVVFFGFLLASPVFGAEIAHFDATIDVLPDSSMVVREIIAYDFGAEERHGIFRNIPVQYKARGGNYNLRVSHIRVSDENATPYIFKVTSQGENLHIKIGDPNATVSGLQTYVLTYTVRRALNYFEDHAELYWNITGNAWTVPIREPFATVNLPRPAPVKSLQADCFVGYFSSRQKCKRADAMTTPDGAARSIEFVGGILSPGEGLTIVAGFPNNLVSKPSILLIIWQTVEDNWILILPIVTLAGLIYLWRTRGRDPQGRGETYPQYESPEGLTPAEIGTIIDEKAQNRDVSAAIVDLAVRGYLKITRTEEKDILATSVDYILEKLKGSNDLANDFEKDLLRDLFKNGTRLPDAGGPLAAVKFSDLKAKFYQDLQHIKNTIYKTMVAKGYFAQNPNTVRGAYIGAGIALIILGIFIGRMWGGLGVFSFILSGVFCMAFSFAMPRRTLKGVQVREHIVGLKTYLAAVEKERLEFQMAPEKNPARFEKLLPYAMVLGVEEKWAKQFEGIYTQPPTWYSDPAGRGMFNAVLFASSMHSFSSHANSVLTATPRSASSGRSGFGGGGFSGGGFGGGGGGSW